MTSFHLKKNLAFEKKKNYLFLRRLENEGVRIRINQDDKDLLRFYGNPDEEEAQKELEKAMVKDLMGPYTDLEYG